MNRHPFGANMAIRKSFHDKYLFPTDLGRKGTLLLSGEESWIFEQMKKEGKAIFISLPWWLITSSQIAA